MASIVVLRVHGRALTPWTDIGQEGEMHRRPEQPRGPDDDGTTDAEAYDGVEPCPAGERCCCAGDERTQSDRGVRSEMQERPANVEVGVATAQEQKGARAVGDHTDGGDPHHRPGCDR